jgi:2-methylcitrate dehydratase PrpD
MIITESGQACKPINPANAARIGILSAKLAKKGIESSVYPLESKKGWFHAMSDQVDENAITDGLGEIFTITESYLKPYPSCRHTHCGIDAALSVREEVGDITAELVDSIEVHIYSNAIRIAGQIELPKCAEDSKFSIHYSLATALLKGHFDLDDLPVENVTEDIKAVVGKIRLVEDETMEDRKAGIRGAKTVIRLVDGREFVRTVLVPKGDAANPFTRDDMLAKLLNCTEGLLCEDCAGDLFAAAEQFETIRRFQSINALIP